MRNRRPAMTVQDHLKVLADWVATAKHNRKYQTVAGCVVIGFVFLLCFVNNGDNASATTEPEARFKEPLPRTPEDWKKLKFTGQVPEAVLDRFNDVEIQEGTLFVMGMPVFYRQARCSTVEPKLEVLLLHGAAFSSKTWLELHTLPLLAAMGHHVVAVDLPGGQESLTPSVPVAPHFQKDFLEAFINNAKMEAPVIVSPSMSGTFSLSLLRSKPEKFAAFVPIAPVDNEKDLTESYLSTLKVPTLVLYGSEDTKGKVVSKKLARIPTSKLIEIPEATHPAYIDQPDFFHEVMYNFLKMVSELRGLE